VDKCIYDVIGSSLFGALYQAPCITGHETNEEELKDWEYCPFCGKTIETLPEND
jgi:hypothetical protein